MKAPQTCSPKGFTLMESVIALLILGAVSLAIISLNGNLFLRSTEMRELQQGAQLLQACLDQVVGTRKTSGFAATPDCSELNTLVAGITLAVNPNATVEYCPPNLQCKQIEIQVIRNGITSKPVSLLFVNY